jgi:hypothetical protein
MFKTLYCCPRTIARHENGPLYESRRAYLEHLAAQGSSRKTLRVAAEVIYSAAVYMRLDSSDNSGREASGLEFLCRGLCRNPEVSVLVATIYSVSFILTYVALETRRTRMNTASSYGLTFFGVAASVASAASCSVVVWYFVTNEWRRSGIFAYKSSICASWTRTSQPLQALIVSSLGLVSPEMTILRSDVSKR